VETPI